MTLHTEDDAEVKIILAFRRMTPIQQRALFHILKDLGDLADIDRVAKRFLNPTLEARAVELTP